MRVKSVISRMGKKISLAMLAIVCGAAIGAGAWSLKSAQSAVSVSAEEGANTKFNAVNDLFTCTNVTPTVATIGDNKGIKLVNGGANVKTWKVGFKGVFTGDLNLEYLIQNSTTWKTGAKFLFKNIDGTELFVIAQETLGNDYQINDWNNQISISVLGEDGTRVSYGASKNARPYMNTEVAGNISIEWAESGAVVSFTKDTSKTILANFNGESTYGSGETAVTLPKITLPENGYVVEIVPKGDWQPCTVTLTKINGISVVDGEVNTQTFANQLGLLNASEATYTANSQAGEFDYSGMQFSVANGVATTLAPTYTDDTFEMKYSIPGSGWGANSGVKLVLTDNSGNEIISIKKFISENGANGSTGGVTGIHNYCHKMTVMQGETAIASESMGYLPFMGQSTTLGTVKFEFADGGLNIYNACVQNPSSQWSFGWTYYNEYKKVCTIADVAKPAKGYKISFAGLNDAATILINSINGKVCTGVVEDKAADFSVDISAAGESVNESGVAALNLKRGANPFTATVKNAKFAGITLNEYTKSVDISSLDLSADKTADISYLGVTKTYAVNVYDYVVTLNDGENQTKQYLEATETASFVAGAQSDKIFIGYANGSNLYGVNSAYTPTEDIIFNAAYIDFAMHTGASVRKQTDENNQYGMRFLAGIAETDLEKYGGFITETGVLILPEDLRAGKEITLDNFSAENKEILKIANEGNEFAKGVNVTNFEGYGVYTGVITSILPANINRKFSARGYAVIKYSDNTTAIIYTAFGVENNSRSAYEVAKAAKEAGETGAALDYYISAVDGNN